MLRTRGFLAIDRSRGMQKSIDQHEEKGRKHRRLPVNRPRTACTQGGRVNANGYLVMKPNAGAQTLYVPLNRVIYLFEG